MTLAADDYPMADLLWTFVFFFALMAYFWLLITVFNDLFRRDLSGWAKELLDQGALSQAEFDELKRRVLV